MINNRDKSIHSSIKNTWNIINTWIIIIIINNNINITTVKNMVGAKIIKIIMVIIVIIIIINLYFNTIYYQFII